MVNLHLLYFLLVNLCISVRTRVFLKICLYSFESERRFFLNAKLSKKKTFKTKENTETVR